MLLAGLLVFGVASTAAAYAGGIGALIAARAVMGAGAALMPATLSLLISVFEDERERATAVGIWAATAGLGVALGPVVGGYLLEHFWWGSIFIVNVPLCVLAIAVGRRVVPESLDAAARRIDSTGAALSARAWARSCSASSRRPTEGWTAPAVTPASATRRRLLGRFVRRERRTPRAAARPAPVPQRRFSAASAAIMVLFFALFGFLFLATQYLQFVLGFSPVEAGVRVLPYAGAMILFASVSARLVAAFGTKRVATLGMLLFAAGLAIAGTLDVGTGYGRLALAFVAMGAGMGLAGAPATESIMNALPPARANVGSAVNDTTRELGGALGVAVVGSLASAVYAAGLPSGTPEAASDSVGAAVAAGGPLAAAAQDAFVQALATASIVAAAVAAVGALIAWRHLPDAGDADRATAAVDGRLRFPPP